VPLTFNQWNHMSELLASFLAPAGSTFAATAPGISPRTVARIDGHGRVQHVGRQTSKVSHRGEGQLHAALLE
jgi:hypothetical protein